MIEPVEETPGRFGHPNWKLNMFAGIALTVIGIAMVGSVVLIVPGAITMAVGAAWAIAAYLVGVSQERADMKRGIHHDHVAGT